MALDPATAKIVKTLQLNFANVKVVGAKNKGGWSAAQEKGLVSSVNRFASAAKKQYNEGDFKNAYLNMRIYANTKNKLLGEPVDSFDVDDALLAIDRQMRTTSYVKDTKPSAKDKKTVTRKKVPAKAKKTVTRKKAPAKKKKSCNLPGDVIHVKGYGVKSHIRKCPTKKKK